VLYPQLERTASGNQAIILQQCSAQDFSELAAKWSALLGARQGKVIIGLDQSQCDILINGLPYWLAWDIWQAAICLEPQDDDAAMVIPHLFSTVMRSA